MGTGVLAGLALALVPGAAPAQMIATLPDSGFVRGAAPRSADAARSSCLPAPVPGAVETPCRLVEWVPLGETGGVRWTAVRYLRAPAGEEMPSGELVSFDEVVLLSSDPGVGVLLPHWRLAVDRLFQVAEAVTGEERPEGLLVEILTCLRGTGGCGRDYMLARGGSIDVVDMRFVDELRRGLPPGHRLHKGMTLDLATLEGVWPVALDRDANCCPSLELHYAVELDGAALVLRRAELREPASPSSRGPDHGSVSAG